MGGGVSSSASSCCHFYCHACARTFVCGASQGQNGDARCVYCQSTFVEEGYLIRGTQRNLTVEQTRRLTNASFMLQLLEAQFHDDLYQLHRVMQQPEAAKVEPLNCAEINSFWNVTMTLDMLNSQSCCAICSDEYSVGDNSLLQLPCSHIYHRDCVMPWLEAHRTCPVCRCDVSKTDNVYVPSVEDIKKFNVVDILRKIESNSNSDSRSGENSQCSSSSSIIENGPTVAEEKEEGCSDKTGDVLLHAVDDEDGPNNIPENDNSSDSCKAADCCDDDCTPKASKYIYI